jgi:hypothetical protein
VTIEEFTDGLGPIAVKISIAEDGTWTCSCGEEGRGGAYWLYVHRRIMHCREKAFDQ